MTNEKWKMENGKLKVGNNAESDSVG